MADAATSKKTNKTKHAGRDGKARESRHSGWNSVAPTAIPAAMRSAVPAGGMPLPADVKGEMEGRFGEHFDDVILHDGPTSADLATSLHARAYTLGPHIVFGAGRFVPQSADGKRLLSHELAHVVQQRRGGSRTGVAQETDADRASVAVSSGAQAHVGTAAATSVQCAPMSADEIARADEQQLRKRLQENENEYQMMVGSDESYKELEAEAKRLHKAIQQQQKFAAFGPSQGKSIAPKGPEQTKPEVKYVFSNQPLDPEDRAIAERKARDSHQMMQILAPGMAKDMMKQPWYAKSMGVYVEDPAEHALPVIPTMDPGAQAPMFFDMSSLGVAGKSQIGGSPDYWKTPRGKSRLKLQDELRSLKSRLERMQGIYKDVVKGSIVIRNVLEEMGGVEPPSAARLNKVFSLLVECEKQIDTDRLEDAVKNSAQAGATLREFEYYWSRYTDFLEIGGKNTIQSLEMVRDTSKYSLMVLSAGGGLAVTAVGALGTLAINTTEAVTNAALGEKVDWVKFTLQAALDLLLAKHGGAIARGFVGKLIKIPAFAKLGESALLPLVHAVLNGAEVRAAYSTFEGLYKGDLTWGKLMDAVFDPNGILLDIVLGGVAAKLKKDASLKSAEPKAKPTTTDVDSAPSTKTSAQGAPANKTNVTPTVPAKPAQTEAKQDSPFQGGKRPPVSEKTRGQKQGLKNAELGASEPIPIGRAQAAPPQKPPPNEPQAVKREATNDAPVESKPGPRLEVIRGGKEGSADPNRTRASTGENSGKAGQPVPAANASTAAVEPPAATQGRERLPPPQRTGKKLPASNRGVPDEVIDDALAELSKDNPFQLGVGKKRAQQIQSGERDFALDQPTSFHIDEPLAVGAPNIKPQRRVQRALDPHNRQLLDPPTNVIVKHVRTNPADIARGRQRLPAVSVTRDPAAVFTRRFDEVVELRQVFNQAVAMIGNPGALKATALKARINANIRDIIQNGRSVEGLMVRDALTAQGFEFQPGRGIVNIKQSTPSGTRQRIATEGTTPPGTGATASQGGQQRVRIADPDDAAAALHADDALSAGPKKKKLPPP